MNAKITLCLDCAIDQQITRARRIVLVLVTVILLVVVGHLDPLALQALTR
jgi:hypothetical protein